MIGNKTKCGKCKSTDIIKYDEEYYKNVGFAQGYVKGDTIGNDLYSGPSWFSDNMKDIYNSHW